MRHPTREEFDRFSPVDLSRFARDLCLALPCGWTIRGLRPGRGGCPAELIFSFGEARFSYLPGGEAEIGFDVTTWQPNPRERANWERHAGEPGYELPIEKHVARVIRPVRRRGFEPLLCETRPNPCCKEELPETSEEARYARDYIAQHASSIPPNTACSFSEEHTSYHLEPAPGKPMRVRRTKPLDRAAFCLRLAQRGFRLPTSEERAYACAGGSRTLYAWGDHAPSDRYPLPHMEKFVETLGDDAWDSAFPKIWTVYREPNAWGVLGLDDPADHEVVAEPDLRVGGDVCEGFWDEEGYVRAWIALSPSWLDPVICKERAADEWAYLADVARRVLPLG